MKTKGLIILSPDNTPINTTFIPWNVDRDRGYGEMLCWHNMFLHIEMQKAELIALGYRVVDATIEYDVPAK